MKSVVLLDCCGWDIKTGTKLYEFIDAFRTKNGHFFRRNLSDGRPIEKEMLLLANCPKCRHRILKYLWYSKKNCRFQDWDEEKIIRGKKADEIFSRRFEDYTLIKLPNPFKPKTFEKQSKKIPWVYYKTIENGRAQIPRYIDESQDAGFKINSPLIVS